MRTTIELLRHETPGFIIAPNLWLLYVSDFNPVDDRIMAMLQEWDCQHPVWDLISWGNVWLTERWSLIKHWLVVT